MSALTGVVGQMLMRVLAGLGIAFVSYQGLDEAFQQASSAINTYMDGAPSDVVAIFKIMGIYTAVKIYLAAWGAAIGVRLAFRVLRFTK
ncbi:hypothetical protein ABIC63_000234 [Pseudacidovorax sp. 1753]|uniref:DUF2523 family protein n=1 Tax=Pseudacidovorax sp. 1753 TaxID=3156419 RepID=UPI003390EF54